MRDQADGLRRMTHMPGARDWSDPDDATVIVIGSGKGGVGKSVLSIFLASSLARTGKRVLLVDGSQNQGNLHILLGVRPASGLEAVLAGEIGPRDLLVPVRDRFSLLPVGSGAEAVYALTPTDRARLHLRLTEVYPEFDVVIVDSGTGIESAIRSTMKAGRLVVVSVPEPAALSDAYALIKMVALQVPSLPIDVLVNQAMDGEEGRVSFALLHLAAERFLRREIGYLGFVAEHPALRRAVRVPGDLLRNEPEELAAIAGRLVDLPAPQELAADEERAPIRGAA
jgi:flagellar biosynthesis protein FlhG